MILWFCRLCTRIMLKHRLYYRWSLVYQWLFEHRHLGRTLPVFSSLESIEDIVGKMVWRKDTWYMLGDAIGHPHATWDKHALGKAAGDCDDISFFAAVAIFGLGRLGYSSVIDEVGLLTVPWMKSKWRVGGHNVCAFSYKEDGKRSWAHISNWHGGKIQKGYDSLQQMVLEILGGKKSLGWAFVDHRFGNLEYHRGEEVQES